MLRTSIRSTSGWVFGFAATVLFISLWGRAVVVDTESLAEAAMPLSDSVAVVDMISGWIEAELIDNGMDPETTVRAIGSVLQSSEVDDAVEALVARVVHAAGSPAPRAATVDVAGLLAPTVPQIAEALRAAGVPVSTAQVSSLVAGLDPLVVRASETSPYVGGESPIAARFGTAAMLAMLVMGVAAWAAVAVSPERLVELRRLLTRMALGGLSFGILLRIGSWVLDPGGGRAPVSESLALVAGSKWLVPIAIASVAGGAAAVMWFVRRWGESPMPAGSPRPEREPELLSTG